MRGRGAEPTHPVEPRERRQAMPPSPSIRGRAREQGPAGGAERLGAEPAPTASARRPHTARPFVAAPCYAVQFLTICPPILRRPPAKGELGAAEAFFPVVGLVLGAILAAADALLGPLLGGPVRDVCLVALLAAMTGALHLDGLVDTFDGLFAGPDQAARLAVMRDPRAGAYGVVAVTCLLLLEVAALGALSGPARAPALILAPGIGRWAIVEATWLFPYARPEGLGRAFKDEIRAHHAVIAGLLACGAAAWLAGPIGLGVVGGATLFGWGAGSAIAGRLGGLTGDTYGGLCELVQVGVWVALGSPALGAWW